MNIRIDDVAQPACRMPVINNATIYMPDHGCLAAVNFSDARIDTRLFLIDVHSLTSESFRVPDDQHGAYGFVRGSDGNLYMGFFGGRIYMFAMTTRTFTRVADPFPDQFTWGGGASRNGKVYMGVYPTGKFCEYDVRTRACEVFAPMPEEKLGFYAGKFVELYDGRILVEGDSKQLLDDPKARELYLGHDFKI